MKFSKAFTGVKSGDVYPTEFKAGDECPAELLEAAKELGAVKAEAPAKREVKD